MEPKKQDIPVTPITSEIVPRPTHLPNGHFAKGNNLSKGNPYTSQMQAFQRVVLTSIKKHELRELIRVIYGKALEGDMNAAKLLVERLCGKQIQDAGIQVTNLSQGNMIIRVQMQGENDESPLEVRQEQQDG